VVWPLTARGQKRNPTVGMLSETPDGAAWYQQGLADFGYVAGQNISLIRKIIEGNLDRLDQFAAEVVALNPDVILAGGSHRDRQSDTPDATRLPVSACVPSADRSNTRLSASGSSIPDQPMADRPRHGSLSGAALTKCIGGLRANHEDDAQVRVWEARPRSTISATGPPPSGP
jgi:hypothetical protein